MRFGTIPLSCIMLASTACTIESGGEQAPVFEGEGITITDDGNGRTVSVDTTVPLLDVTCASGEFVQWDGTDWACATPSNTSETDPTVNSLGKTDLSTPCSDDEVLAFNATSGAWSCQPYVLPATVTAIDTRLMTAESSVATNTLDIATNAAGVATNSGSIATNTSGLGTQGSSITVLQGQVAALEAELSDARGTYATLAERLFEIENPLLLRDGFDDNPGTYAMSGTFPAEEPSGTTWQVGTTNGMTVSGSALQVSGSTSDASVTANGRVSDSLRVRFVVAMGSVQATSEYIRVSLRGVAMELLRIEMYWDMAPMGASVRLQSNAIQIGSASISSSPPTIDYYVEATGNGGTWGVVVSTDDYATADTPGTTVATIAPVFATTQNYDTIQVAINDGSGGANLLREIEVRQFN